MNERFFFIKTRLKPLFWLFAEAHKQALTFSWEEEEENAFDLFFQGIQKSKSNLLLFQDELKDLKNGLNSQSVHVVDECLRFYDVYMEAVSRLRKANIENMISKSSFQSEEQKKAIIQWEKNKKGVISEIGLNVFDRDLYMECGYYHHGLKLLPSCVLENIKNTIFIDAGACIGESSLLFSKMYAPSKILAFEISQKNIERLQQNIRNSEKISGHCKIEICPWGLGAREQDLCFDDNGCGSTTMLKQGTSKVQIKPLDSLLPDTGRIGFIKADLEGFAVEMTKGMLSVLKRDHPVLSISIYHTWEEFTQVKKIIQSNFPEYHIEYHNLGKTVPEENILLAWSN